MDKQEANVLEYLEYLLDTIERAPKVPMSGKVMVDKKEFMETIDDIINCLPDQFKKAQWVMNERERILAEAKREYDSVKEETMILMRQNIENHDIVKEAKIRAQEILATAKRESKNLRVSARDYADEILTDLDEQMENKKMELIKSLQVSFEDTAREIDENLTKACSIVKENIKELRSMD
ncbi:ATPase [Clostridium sp.]|uniref:ATPase n=1 Tax=Clostridium sp. TaxID=1506 RepID=UPI0026DC6B5E|nr:ATPase [Clostridium sp.]MDO5038170.1 ATPase [Clostridium sp.]